MDDKSHRLTHCLSSYGVQVTCESDGLCRVGWATRAASYEIGKDRRSFGYGSTGKKSHGGSFEDYGTPFGKVNAAPALPACSVQGLYLVLGSGSALFHNK